jgi:hypothetical protein
MRRIFADRPLTDAERNKRYYEKHKEAELERNKAYYPAYYAKVRERRLAYQRNRKYGMSQGEFEAKKSNQDNRCAICRKEFEGTPCVDHNHVLKNNRDLLCPSCNVLIGMCYESVEILSNAIQYLEKWKCQTLCL